jgi:hypothetical protein
MGPPQEVWRDEAHFLTRFSDTAVFTYDCCPDTIIALNDKEVIHA